MVNGFFRVPLKVTEDRHCQNFAYEYIYADGERIALFTEQHGVVNYYINDHLGTPQRLLDQNGAIVWEASYEAFGLATINTATVEQNHRFPGQYYDAESGLHYNWNRYYEPKTGRYVSSDPIGLDGGINTFGYVGGNPLVYADREGLQMVLPGPFPLPLPIPEWTEYPYPELPNIEIPEGFGTALACLINVALCPVLMCDVEEDAPARDIDFIPGKPETATPGGELTEGEAIEVVRGGGDVIAEDQGKARDIAGQAGVGEPVLDPPHGPGQRQHYHPVDAHGNRLPGHVLF